MKKHINTPKPIFFLLICVICVTVFSLSLANKALSQIKILSPKSTDSLIVGEEVKILLDNLTGNSVSLYYSNDSGNTWNIISKNLKSNNFTWKIPYLSKKDLLIKAEEDVKINLTKKWENLQAHLKEVRNCEFSGDGKYFITSGDDSYFRIWNVEKSVLKHEFKHTILEKEKDIFPILCAQFVGGIDTVTYCYNNSVWLWNSQTNSTEKLFDLYHTAYFVSVDNNTNNIAVCSHSTDDPLQETVFIYSLKERKILNKLNNPSAPKDNYYRCRYSPSGRYLAFVGYDKIINLYDTQEDTLYNYMVKGGIMAMMGVDFSFDETEIVVCGLDGVIRRFSVPNLDTLATYNNIVSVHARSIRYVSPNGDFICGGVGDFNFIYGNLITQQFDSINTGFQITDVNYYNSKYNNNNNNIIIINNSNNKYYLVSGREPHLSGKFILFELNMPQQLTDIVSCNVFYKFNAKIAKKQKVKYGDTVNFNVDFTHNYKLDSLPFSEASVYALVKFPYKMLDFSIINVAPYRPPTSTEVTYAIRIDDVLTHSRYYNLKAKVLLASQPKAPISFEFCYSSNNMILFETEDGYIEIQSECSEEDGRFITSAPSDFLTVEEVAQGTALIKLNINCDNDIYDLTISNLQGAVLLCKEFNKSGYYEFTISSDKTTPGLYFIQLLPRKNIFKNILTNKFILLN